MCKYACILLKIGGPRYVTYFWEVPRYVTKCDMGWESKLVKNSVTNFMDGPLARGRTGRVYSSVMGLGIKVN